MSDLSVTVVMPKELFADPKKLQRIVENTLNEAAKGVQMEFIRTAWTWEHKPEFKIDSSPGKRVIFTTDIIYFYISGGTKPHPIPKVIGRRLAFYKTGFRAKSRVNSLNSGAGARATQDFRMPYQVQHPGTEARNFDRTIKMRWDKYLPVQMQRAIDAEF